MTPTPAALAADDLLRLPDRLDGSSWDELEDLLHDDWLSMHDGRDRWLLRVRDGLGLVEEPGRLRARERRALHRADFRLQRAGDLRVRTWVWVWAPPEGPPSGAGDVGASLRRWQVEVAAVRAQAVRTVRDVLRADPRSAALPEPEVADAEGGCACGA